MKQTILDYYSTIIERKGCAIRTKLSEVYATSSRVTESIQIKLHPRTSGPAPPLHGAMPKINLLSTHIYIIKSKHQQKNFFFFFDRTKQKNIKYTFLMHNTIYSGIFYFEKTKNLKVEIHYKNGKII